MLLGISVSVGVYSCLSTSDATYSIEALFGAQMLQTAKIVQLFYPNMQSYTLLPMVEDALNQLMPQNTDYQWDINIEP